LPGCLNAGGLLKSCLAGESVMGGGDSKLPVISLPGEA